MATSTGKKAGFGANLKGIGKAWASARAKAEESAGAGWIDEPMTGNFVLAEAKVDTIGSNNWLHAAFRFICFSEGDYRGLAFIHRCGIDNEDSLAWFIGDLAKMGVEVGSLEIENQKDLDALLAELTAEHPTIRARISEAKNREGMHNMRIQKLLDVDPEEWEDLVEGGSGDGEEEEEGEEETLVDLDAMTRAELKDFIKEQELEITVKKAWSDDELRDAIREALPEPETEEEESEEEEDEVEEEEDGEEEETVELAKGMRISTTIKGKEQAGSVIAVNDKDGTARCKMDFDKKVHVIAQDELEVLEG